MGEAVHCAHCRRPIAAHFTSCPFCKQAQPPRVARPEVIKCATCKRPYNPALASCPFCAREQAGYRDKAPAPAPAHDEYKQARATIEESESRQKLILLWGALGSAVSVIFAIAISAKLHVVGSGHLGTVGAIGFIGGVVAALVGPRFVELEGPALGRRVSLFVVGWIVSTALGYLIVAAVMLGAAGPPQRVPCRVTSHGYAKRAKGTAATTRYTCTLPDRSSLFGTEGHGAMPLEVGATFTMEVRTSPGGWLYVPESVVADPVSKPSL